MSYQVLARKWRPRNFSQLAGQAHVVRALTNALTQMRLHHAYLLTGTRGVGKTTIARILAKSLNCETGVTATPCGICGACVAIDEGRFVDLIELDAASSTGIDNMREILDTARYAPTVGRYKVYLIDEVHMLSRNAFASMLKTLEEPPEHVKFVLATTDPQKIPITVLSRCLQFNLKQLPPNVVAGQLEHVLKEEGIAFEPGAIRVLSRAAQGSMRDGLSLLDQAIAYGGAAGGGVDEASVRQMLGAVETDYVLRLLEALAASDGAALLDEARAMSERNLALDASLQELAVALHDIALLQTVPTAVADEHPDRDRLAELARRLDAETIQLYYQIAIQGRTDLPLAPDEYAGFSMTLLRMLAFAPADTVAVAKGAPSSGGGRVAAGMPGATPTAPVATTNVLGAKLTMPVATTNVRDANPTAPVATTNVPGAKLTTPIGASRAAPLAPAAPASSKTVAEPAPRVPPPMAPVPAGQARADSMRPNAQAALTSTPTDRASITRDERRAAAMTSDLLASMSSTAQTPTLSAATLTMAPLSTAPAGAPQLSTIANADLRIDDWASWVRESGLSGLAQQLANNAELRAHRATETGLEVELVLAESNRHLSEKMHHDKLREALVNTLGVPVRLKIDLGGACENSIAASEKRVRQQLQDSATANFNSDPFVRETVRLFDARVRQQTIQPVTGQPATRSTKP